MFRGQVQGTLVLWGGFAPEGVGGEAYLMFGHVGVGIWVCLVGKALNMTASSCFGLYIHVLPPDSWLPEQFPNPLAQTASISRKH